MCIITPKPTCMNHLPIRLPIHSLKLLLSLVLVSGYFNFFVACQNKPLHNSPTVSSGHIDYYPGFISTHVPSRDVVIWLPEDYPTQAPYQVLYMNDGQMLFDSTTTWNGQEWGVDEILSHLIRNGEVPQPSLWVYQTPRTGIPNISRKNLLRTKQKHAKTPSSPMLNEDKTAYSPLLYTQTATFPFWLMNSSPSLMNATLRQLLQNIPLSVVQVWEDLFPCMHLPNILRSLGVLLVYLPIGLAPLNRLPILFLDFISGI